MLTFGADGFDSLLLPLMVGALLMGLLRALVFVCARATTTRDARAASCATRATQAASERSPAHTG